MPLGTGTTPPPSTSQRPDRPAMLRVDDLPTHRGAIPSSRAGRSCCVWCCRDLRFSGVGGVLGTAVWRVGRVAFFWEGDVCRLEVKFRGYLQSFGSKKYASKRAQERRSSGRPRKSSGHSSGTESSKIRKKCNHFKENKKTSMDSRSLHKDEFQYRCSCHQRIAPQPRSRPKNSHINYN